MKLTNEQIKQNGLAMIEFAGGKPIQEFNTSNKDKGWYDVSEANFYVTGYLWRTKPQPVSRPWSKPEDAPLHCWIRVGKGEPERLVTMIATDGLWTCWAGGGSAFFAWSSLDPYEHSTDRVTWKPCTVEEQP
jgi:hypothetical protein